MTTRMAQLRRFAVEACNVMLAMFLITALVFQGRDFHQASEVVPASSFAVLLSLASFAISWARVNPPNATASEQQRVKRIALDLLIASALTLVSAGLLLLSANGVFKTSLVSSSLLVLHIAFLATGLWLGWLALSRMLREAARIPTAS